MHKHTYTYKPYSVLSVNLEKRMGGLRVCVGGAQIKLEGVKSYLSVRSSFETTTTKWRWRGNLRLASAASQTTIKSCKPIFNSGGNLVQGIQEHFECMVKVNWVSVSSADSTVNTVNYSPTTPQSWGLQTRSEISIVFPKQWATSKPCSTAKTPSHWHC